MRLFGSQFGCKPPPKPALWRGGPFLAGLDSYPPWQLPHLGPSSTLRDEELDANLGWFQESRATRLLAAQALLGDLGATTAPLLDPRGHGRAAMAAIQAALERELPERADLPGDHDPTRDFRAYGAIGPRIFYAFAADLGTLIGEAVALRRPGTRWKIARNQNDIGTPFYRSIVLAEPATGDRPAGVFDMLGATIDTLYELRRDGVGLRPDLGELLTAQL